MKKVLISVVRQNDQEAQARVSKMRVDQLTLCRKRKSEGANVNC